VQITKNIILLAEKAAYSGPSVDKQNKWKPKFADTKAIVSDYGQEYQRYLQDNLSCWLRLRPIAKGMKYVMQKEPFPVEYTWWWVRLIYESEVRDISANWSDVEVIMRSDLASPAEGYNFGFLNKILF
jgi:hypothetical protein